MQGPGKVGEAAPSRWTRRLAVVVLVATALTPVGAGLAQPTPGGTATTTVTNDVVAAAGTNPLCGLLGGFAAGAAEPAAPSGNPLRGLLGGLFGGADAEATPPANPLCGLLGGLLAGERAAVSASVGVSHVDTGNAFGIGTVVNGAVEQYLAGIESGISRAGFSLAGAIATYGLLGGTGSLYLDFAWALGYLQSSGREEVGVGGVSQLGLTFLYLDGGLGTGVGTNFAGDALIGEAEFSNRWSVTGFGYQETLPAPIGLPGSRVDYSIGISYETLRQGGIAAAEMVRGDTVLASQDLITGTIDRYLGFRLGAGITTVLSPNVEFRLAGYVTPSIHSSWGWMEQFTDYAGGLTQTLEHDGLGFGVATGLEAELGFRCCGPSGNLGIVLGGEISLLTGVTSVQVPANPLEQPATFEPVTMPRAFGYIGLQARF